MCANYSHVCLVQPGWRGCDITPPENSVSGGSQARTLAESHVSVIVFLQVPELSQILNQPLILADFYKTMSVLTYTVSDDEKN